MSQTAGMLLFLAVLALLANRMIGLGLRRNWRPGRLLAGITLVILGLVMLNSYIADQRAHRPWMQQWNRGFERSLKATTTVYEQLGWKKEELDQAGQLVRIFFKDAIWAWMGTLIALMLLLSYRLQRRWRPGLARGTVPLAPIEQWKLPPALIWLTIAACLFMVMGTRLAQGHALFLIGINLAVGLMQLYGLAGLGIVFHYINRKKWPQASKVMVMLLIALLPVVMGAVIVLGLSDTWWDWRRPVTRA